MAFSGNRLQEEDNDELDPIDSFLGYSSRRQSEMKNKLLKGQSKITNSGLKNISLESKRGSGTLSSTKSKLSGYRLVKRSRERNRKQESLGFFVQYEGQDKPVFYKSLVSD